MRENAQRSQAARKILDTLQLSKDLQPAFDPEQAETLSPAQAAEPEAGDRATKTDFVTSGGATKADSATLRTDFAALRDATKRWIDPTHPR